MTIVYETGDFAVAIAAVGGIISKTLAAFAAILNLQIKVYKMFDKGRGIILTRYGWVGPFVPSSQ